MKVISELLLLIALLNKNKFRFKIFRFKIFRLKKSIRLYSCGWNCKPFGCVTLIGSVKSSLSGKKYSAISYLVPFDICKLPLADQVEPSISRFRRNCISIGVERSILSLYLLRHTMDTIKARKTSKYEACDVSTSARE